MATDIVLLDIPTTKGIPTSPSTWRVRLTLNYKRLNYRTQWVATADIEKVTKPLGMLPTGVKPDGSPHYTLPAIIDRTDPSHPVYLSDSMPIVEYLEKTYPAPPGAELFPANTIPFQKIVAQFAAAKLYSLAHHLLLSGMYALKTPDEQADLRRRTEARFKKPFESIEKRGAERETVLWGLEQELRILGAALHSRQSGDGEFLMGRQVCFADFAIAAWLIMVKVASPDDVCPRLNALDGGRWKKYLEGFQDWMIVDNGLTKVQV